MCGPFLKEESLMRRATSLTVALIAVLVAATAGADEDAAPASPWSGNLGLAYVATSGNSDTQTFGLDFKLEREPEPWGFEVSALFNRAEDSGATTAERYFAGIRGKRALNERWDLFVGVSGEKDQFAGYDLETVGEVGATYKLLLGPTHLLSFDAGLTYTDLNAVEPEDDTDFMGGLAGLSYEWKVSDTASVTERLVWYPNFDTSSDWRLTSETGVTASLTSALALKLGYELRYRNQPIGDNSTTDTTTKASLVVKF